MSTSTLLSLNLKTLAELSASHASTHQALRELQAKLPQLTDLQEIMTLSNPLPGLQKQEYLYRCSNCRELLILPERLQVGNLAHACNPGLLCSRGRLSQLLAEAEGVESLPLGSLELLASGPLQDLIQWAHSIQLGLDNSFKGI
jgi:hypothetical protein